MKRNLATVLLLLASIPARAQVAPVADASLLSLRADHIEIGVDSLDQTATWYVDKLGFKIEKVWTVDGLPGVKLAYLSGHGFRLELVEGGAGKAAPKPETFPQHFARKGFQHLAFSVESVDDVMAILARKGVPAFVPPASYPKGARRRVGFVQDPEGNVIEFTVPIEERAK